jgi:phosphoglycerate dehydrogenase-like enzyme
MHVPSHDVLQDGALAAAHDIAGVPRESLLRQTDVVALHGSLTRETGQIINRERRAMMKPATP